MPKNYKRKYRRRRRGAGSGSGYLSTASKALSVAYAVKRLVNVEKKKFDVGSTSNPSSSGNTFANLVAITQGDDGHNRDGNSIKATNINIRYQALANVSSTSTYLRLALVRDNQQVADSSPSWTDVFETADVNSHLNHNTVGRFSILYDRTMILSNSNTLPDTYGKIQQPLNHHIRYNGTTANDIQKGGLFLMGVSNEPTNTPTVIWQSRVSFIDN